MTLAGLSTGVIIIAGALPGLATRVVIVIGDLACLSAAETLFVRNTDIFAASDGEGLAAIKTSALGHGPGRIANFALVFDAQGHGGGARGVARRGFLGGSVGDSGRQRD